MNVYDSRVVSNHLVEAASQDDNLLTPMQVLKLVYIAHGYNLGFHKTPLIKNRIEAWKYGPVIPDLYQAIKHRRDQPVELLPVNGLVPMDEDDKAFVSAVYKAYRDYDGIELSALTHQDGTPWDLVYDKRFANEVISNDIIENHYKGLIAGQ